MEPIHLFQLAAQQARYLSTSQSLIADNVANANTPGYQARAVQPFSEVLANTNLAMTTTHPNDIAITPAEAAAPGVGGSQPWEVSESGNSVSLEQEMIKAGEVNRSFSLNTSLVKSFHAMLMSTVRS